MLVSGGAFITPNSVPNIGMLKLLPHTSRRYRRTRTVWTCKSTSARSAQSRTELTQFASYDLQQGDSKVDFDFDELLVEIVV